MVCPVKPVGDKVVVTMLEKEDEVTQGGLVLPNRKPRYRSARVEAVGRGTVADGKLLPSELSVGDVVQVHANAGEEVKVGEQSFFVVPERNVVAIISQSEHSSPGGCSLGMGKQVIMEGDKCCCGNKDCSCR